MHEVSLNNPVSLIGIATGDPRMLQSHIVNKAMSDAAQTHKS